MEYKKYYKTNKSEMRELTHEELNGDIDFKISISKADYDNGSPKAGDMIARNSDNHDDMWLVAKAYFEERYKLV
jgi:hypothetical protein